MRAEQARRRRWRIRLASGAAAATPIAVAAAIVLAVTSSSGAAGGAPSGLSLAPLSTLGVLQPAPAPGATGSEDVPVPAAAPLAGLATAATRTPVDQISCQTGEQTLFHIHAHLAIFVNGKARQVPAAIGIPGAQAQQTPSGPFITTGTCFYWLHTHAADGIIHIESPVQRTYTLGEFFDEWGQALGPAQVGPATGRVVALYDGQVYQGNPRDIPLTAHAQIQLDIGTPLIAPQSVSFPAGL
jgi:hypothetical protein